MLIRVVSVAPTNDQDDRAAANHPTIIEDRDRRFGPSASYVRLPRIRVAVAGDTSETTHLRVDKL